MDSAVTTGDLCDESDLQCWYWWGRAAAKGSTTTLFYRLVKPVSRFSSDPSLAPVVFAIGRVLKGHVNTQKKQLFGKPVDFLSVFRHANRAYEFYYFQIAAARKAVDTWCLVARRMNNLINKDIRNKVGRLVWEARELLEYREPTKEN